MLQLPNGFFYGDLNSLVIKDPTLGHWFNTAGCVLTAAQAGPGDTVVPLGQPCTQGWDKRVGAQPSTYMARVLPYYVDGLRGPNYGQTNVSMAKNFRVNIREHPLNFQLRGDALNVMNHSYFANPSTSPTAGVNSFGVITGAGAQLNRFLQVQLHIRW